MFAWFAQVSGLTALGRREDLDDRTTVLALFARFTDEVASGLLAVLLPTLQRRFGLTVQQVGWCWQALFWSAGIVEPIAGSAVDLGRRRPWLVWGALGWGASLLATAAATGFAWLLVAFAIAGVASGPLAHTADVVLIEGHPNDVERIQGRSATIDTIGALLAPAVVAIAGWRGIDQRIVLVLAGTATLLYALLLAGSVVPTATRDLANKALRQVVDNIGIVAGDPAARRALLALLLIELLDLPELFEPVWLRQQAGLSQSLVAVHVAVGMASSLLGLMALDRWMMRDEPGPVLAVLCAATVVLYPAWMFAPTVAARFVLVVPRDLVMAPLWPILRARALAAAPGRAGTVSALGSLAGLLPLSAGFGWLASQIGLTGTMLMVSVGATILAVAVAPRR